MENKKRGFLSKRTLKYGSNSVILIIAVIVLAFLANLLIGFADIKWDFTSNKLFSLTDVSKNLLKNLNTDVTIIGLFDDGKVGTDYKELTDMLALYQKASKHIKVQYVDPDRNPGIIKQLDATGAMDLQKNDLVIKCTVNGKEKKKKLGYYDLFQTQMDQSTYQEYVTGSTAEHGFTGAIKYVSTEKTPVVYFTEGHGEVNVNSDYKTVKSYLDYNNYEVKNINILTSGKVPEDAALLVVASPKSDLSANERDVINNYLKNGGKAIFMFDYLDKDPDLNEFNNVLSLYNVAVNYDKVKETDESRHLPNDPYTIMLNVNQNPIIPQAFNTELGNSRSISILKNTKEYITATPLMSTGDKAIGEAASSSRGQNNQGPLDIAIAVENKGNANVSRIVVMGNASFISDKYQTGYSLYNNNLIFFVQSINWLIENKDELVVPTKNYDNPTISITQLQSNAVSAVLMVVLPLLILGSGLFVYLRRRHL